MFPDIAPDVVLSQQNLFLARVMSAGDWHELKPVQEHFGKAAFRAVLDAPPSKIFDRPSWNLFQAAFEMEPREMPDSFFTIYPWFKAREMQIKQEKTAEVLSHLPNCTGPVRSCDELEEA